MLFNKSRYAKTNDKKVLHKVGKQWKVISVALLMAIGGTAVATHVNANASSTNDQSNTQTNSLVSYLNGSSAANVPRIAQPQQPAQKEATPAQPSQPALGISYYPGSNGSAASYFDKSQKESNDANSYFNTVNNYVQSLNAEYNPQVRSFAAKSGSASAAAHNDSKLAASYSVENKNPNTASVINSLANKNHATPQLYEGMVQNQEQVYSGEVNSASADVKANSDVESLANSLTDTNFDSASLSASASSVIADSNFVSASSYDSSVRARYDFNGANHAEDFVGIAYKLSAGATTLEVAANNGTYNTNYQSLTSDMNTNQVAATDTSLTAAINSAATSAKSNITSLVNSAMNNAKSVTSELAGYADDQDNTNGDNVLGFNQFVTPTTFNTTYGNQSLFNATVSAAADTQVAPALASAANSLFGKYNPEYANANTLNKERRAEVQSADDALRAATYASDFANANRDLVESVSNDVATSGGASSVASDYLKEGITSVEAHLHLASIANATNGTASTYYEVKNTNNFVNGLVSAVSQATKSTVIGGNNISEDVSQLLPGLLKGINDAPGQKTSDVVTAMNNRVAKLPSKLSSIGATSNDIQEMTTILSDAAKAVSNNSDGVNKVTTYTNGHAQEVVHTNFYNYGHGDGFSDASADDKFANGGYAALLSDGIDLDKLESESGAIANVAAATEANEVANTNTTEDAAEKFGDGLSAAASSAVSALGVAQNASANYSAANDEDVTLSSYFASSYANDASSEANVSTNASNGLNSFFKSMADDNTFASADDAYNADEAAMNNDYKLGAANAKAVFNRSPHFLDVLKGAYIHTTPNFNANNDKAVGSIKKGDRLTVFGVNVSRNHRVRGVIRYFVLDNNNGKKGFVTGLPEFTKPAYLSAVAEHQNVQVKVLEPTNVYSDFKRTKKIGSLKAGDVLNNADVVYGDVASQDAHGFTLVETASDDFVTANTDFVQIVAPNYHQNNNNPQPNTNFNLQNGQLNYDKYYNTDTQD